MVKRKNPSNKAKLRRTTFKTSREMDFFSEKELVTQTGHEIDDWPLVFLKETIDNGLDACEEHDIAPIIDVTADATGITVKDNGPGLPESTLTGAMDFTIRTSNREAYVAPDRGAQGNALKTLIPMPRVVDPKHGKLIVTADGKRHDITCDAHPISQKAVVNDDVKKQPTDGTSFRIQWQPADYDGEPLWPFNELLPLEIEEYRQSFSDRFRGIVEGFAILNPHATFSLDWFGVRREWKATNPEWKKWKPHRPTSPHWYELSHFERLIGGYLTDDRERGEDRLISKVVSEFDGLTGSQKRSKVLTETNLQRVPLSALIVDGGFDSPRIRELLAAMKRHTRPVTPHRLGLIGEDHMRMRLLAMGIEPDSFRYSKKLNTAKCKKTPISKPDKPSFNDLPWVVESAFGWLGEDATDIRRIFSGVNWSAALKNPYRSFGPTGEGLEAVLTDLRAGSSEPVVFVLHLVHPRVEYTDRGKSALVIGR